MKFFFLKAAIPAALLLALTACSSPTENKLKEAERLQKDGYVKGALQESERILAEPDDFTPEQIQKAQAIREAARARLVKFYTSLVNQQLLAENYTEALTTYVQCIAEFPEVTEQAHLNRRVMRAFVHERNFEMARDTANVLLSSQPDPASADDANSFLEGLDKLEAAARTREELTERVTLIGDSIGMDFVSNNFRPSCIVMNETDKLTPESRKVVNDFFAAVTEETALHSELGVIPSMVN